MDRSLRLLQVIREGGGTPGVELRVADKLRARGHAVRVAGSPEVRGYVERGGFPYLELPWPEPGERYGDQTLVPQQLQAAEPWARRLAERVARHGAGLVLDPESPADRIESALRRVITEPGFAVAARRLAGAIARYPDDLVVREIEAVAHRSAPPTIPVPELS